MRFFNSIVVLSSILILNKTLAYKKSDILSETGWNDLAVRKNAPTHLSLISQGKIDMTNTTNDDYDRTYYYPASAGEGVDIYFFDYGFNLTYSDFSNTEARTIQCDMILDKGNLTLPSDPKICSNEDLSSNFHGIFSTAFAAGKNNGAAPKANIHAALLKLSDEEQNSKGLELNTILEGIILDLIEGFKYIKNNTLKPNQTIINLSAGNFYPIEVLETENVKELQKIVNEMAQQGTVFIASAGNDGSYAIDKENKRVFLPCALDNIICVGGVENVDISDLRILRPYETKDDDLSKFQYKRIELYYPALVNNTLNYIPCGTNYGVGVDIYAPATFHYRGEINFSVPKPEASNFNSTIYNLSIYGVDTTKINFADETIFIEDYNGIISGTSFSSPLVTGVVATLMSEHPEKVYNSTSILKYLQKISLNNVVTNMPDDVSNYFLNNGKNSVYNSKDSFEEEAEEVKEKETSVFDDESEETQGNSDSEVELELEDEGSESE